MGQIGDNQEIQENWGRLIPKQASRRIEDFSGMQNLIDELMDFQVKTFPDSNPISKLHHLAKEVPELIDGLTNLGTVYDEKDIEAEYADCFLLLLGSAAIYGFKATDIARIVRHKLAINRNRKWGTPDENGVVQHIKE